MLKLKSEIKSLESYLWNQGWLKKCETIKSIEKPGEGNMNFTQRIITNLRSFIIKQSRDFVEKYPSVAAPKDRVQREAEFYEIVHDVVSLRAMMPQLIGLDADNNVMIMEDLGAGSDFTFLYQENQVIHQNDLNALIGFITLLNSSISRENTSRYIANEEMRKLNHEHIFIYPYMEKNGIDLDAILPGLQEVTNEVKGNTPLLKSLKELGEMYLYSEDKDSQSDTSHGEYLLHGDYFPGSWLKTEAGIKIIDPEFCFFGPVEFEIGIMVAHLKLADQPDDLIQSALKLYGQKINFDAGLQQRCTGAEVLRRILGLAQLPLTIGLEKRKELVEEAVETMLMK